MYRYFALIWDVADPEAGLRATALAERLGGSARGWQRVLGADGLIALHAGVRPGSSETRLVGQSGAVFGTLFTRGSEAKFAPAPMTLDAGQIARIEASHGDCLFEDYWGRYVAVVRDPATAAVHVLRDPTGSLPCFFARHEHLTLVFSDVEDALQLGMRPTINWSYIASLVAYSGLQTRATGLNEVTEVQPGERVSFRGDSQECRLIWNPLGIAQRDRVEDFNQAVEALGRTVRACVQTWAGLYRGVLHNLSGGVDSSIVLSCLMSAPSRTPVTCLTHFGSSPGEDERLYARLAAEHLGARLIECPVDPGQVDLQRVLEIKASARPWFYMYELEHSPLETRLAREHGANAIFSGSGGDGVFFQARADLAVTDYVCLHGMRPHAFRIALDAARVLRSSVWPLLRQAWRGARNRRPWNPLEYLDHPQSLIEPAVAEAAKRNPDLIHVWLRDTAGVPPGIVWHVASLSVPTPFYESFGNTEAPERVFPLLSQPLVELCLRIPTWLTITGGRDRAIPRRAFAAELPAQIVRRRAKGMINQHIRQILDRNLPFVREMLLDGLLVREKLLNRERLDLFLSKERSPANFEYNEIVQQHLCTEAWLRKWQAGGR